VPDDDVIALRARVARLERTLAKVAEATADPPVLLAQAKLTIRLVNWAATLYLGGGPDA
jgi:hypothetical protein